MLQYWYWLPAIVFDTTLLVWAAVFIYTGTDIFPGPRGAALIISSFISTAVACVLRTWLMEY